MSKFIITGGNKLEGKIKLSGNKNSALKLIPATLLADSPTTLTNVPNIIDVDVALQLVENLGAKVKRDGSTVTIDPSSLNSFDPDPTLSS
jgi:UDP-N-acetylglucosamine 1-carboxyvinyltransferase